MPELTNMLLIQRAQQGDPAAVGFIFQQHYQQIFRYLFYKVGGIEAAEDLTSEVFVRMMRGLTEYRHQGGSIQAWLFQIARNLSVDYFRSESHRNTTYLDDTLPAKNEDVETEVDRRLTSAELSQAISELPDDQRDVLILRFVIGLSIADVALIIQRSEDAVKGLQRRGLTALRHILREKENFYV